MTAARRQVARKPAPRTAEATVSEGPYAGWYVKVRADFPAKLLAELQSGNIDRITAALDSIVVEHNLPGTDGTLAKSMADVDPYDGLFTLAGVAFDAIGKLPPR